MRTLMNRISNRNKLTFRLFHKSLNLIISESVWMQRQRMINLKYAGSISAKCWSGPSELDKGSWYVTHPPNHELSQTGSLKQTNLVLIIFEILLLIKRNLGYNATQLLSWEALPPRIKGFTGYKLKEYIWLQWGSLFKNNFKFDF